MGTVSVEESERLSRQLRSLGVSCEVLNARHDAREAAVVARAGRPGAVTISTNMAGRGTDIKLGGPDEHGYEEIVALGGLSVIGVGRNESRCIDLQLRGRAGRQGDPGESRFFVSLDVRGPSSTWTYLVNDDPFKLQLKAMLTGPGKTTFAVGAAMVAMPLLVLWGLVDRVRSRRRP